MVFKVDQLDTEILASFVLRFVADKPLTPAERREVVRIARGLACKTAAEAAGVSPETIRARRKRIYRKLGVPGSGELLSSFLARTIEMLGKGETFELEKHEPESASDADLPPLSASAMKYR